MSVEHHDDVFRRSVLKQAALGGAGLVAGSLLTGAGSGRESAAGPAPEVIFGTAAIAELVRDRKQRVDPGNRFR